MLFGKYTKVIRLIKTVLKVKKLRKSYGSLVAVNNISFSINEGEIVALLGPNGAGKTTTISCLTTLTRPDSTESILIMGKELHKNLNESRKLIGVCPQELNLYKNSTVEENLQLQGYFYGLKPGEINKKIPNLLQIVELTERRNELVKNLSGGMKRRLQIARALISNPKLIFLDEPTTGLSPESRIEIWKHIKSLKKLGLSILLTSHYMEEADQLADRILIMNKGDIIDQGTSDELKERIIGTNQVIIKSPDMAAIEDRLKKINFDFNLVNSNEFSIKNINGKFSELFKKLEGLEITELTLKKPTLEDVFLELTGSRLIQQEHQLNGDA